MLKKRVERMRGTRALTMEGRLYIDKLFAASPPEFLGTPLLMGPVCLISHGRFEEPVRPSKYGV